MALSAEQEQIVLHPPELHAKVLAVAGSGKSHTMVERCAYLVEAKRIDPTRILAVMFGRTAADEFTGRLEKRLGKRNSPASLTFHGLGTLTLRRLIKDGLAPDWLFEAKTSKSTAFAVHVIEDACNRYGHKYPRMVAEAFLGFIDRVKGDLSSPQAAWEKGDWDSKYAWFPEVYPLYEKARERKKIRFFSDLIYDPIVIMAADDKAEQSIAGRYQHVIVDEYQDICEAQQSLVRFNAGGGAKVMVVGDDDQTIYSWRGAKPSYILRDFERDFPGGRTYALSRTWRYGPALSCAANSVITNNFDRADKLCISTEKTPETELFLEWDQDNGRTAILKIVSAWVSKGRKLNEIAILVRTYSKSAAGQFALLQSGTPFRLEGGDDASVLDNPWVASLLLWMQVAAGRFASRAYAGDPDSTALFTMKRIIGTPTLGLSWEGMNKLAVCVLADPSEMNGFMHFIRTGLSMQDGRLSEVILRRGKLWKQIRELRHHDVDDPLALLEKIIDELAIKLFIQKHAKNPDDAADQIEMIDAFLAYVKSRNGHSLSEFLDHVDDLRSFSLRAKTATDAIHMTSVHRSKGLEWPCVIIPGCVEGWFPHKPRRALEPEAAECHMEDERRLFYVAMTRAREQLHFLAPPDALLHQWLRAGRSGSPAMLSVNGTSASRFLYESNIYLSKAMPHMLRRDVNLRAGGPEVFNRYLEEVGITDRRVAKIEAPVSTEQA